MLQKIKIQPNKGFLGEAKQQNRPPFHKVKRTASMYSYGNSKYFSDSPNNGVERYPGKVAGNK